VVKINGGPALVLARFDAGIKSTSPFPLVDVGRTTHAPRDGADVDIAVIDVPAVWPFGIAASGKAGHRP
jgi:hypothetical protein